MTFDVYITTNPNRDALYVGVTNSLTQRIIEHYLDRGSDKTYAGKYFCYCLVFYESFNYVNNAIQREKEIKKWNRTKKIKLIETFNPKWMFLNIELLGYWPPIRGELIHRRD